MSGDGRRKRESERQVAKDALGRLVARLDRKSVPLTDEELATLTKRAREAYYSGERSKARLARYQAHLARTHGEAAVAEVSAVLTDVLNEIGWEEK